MQNKETLIELGFLDTPISDEFIWRGKYQIFIAQVMPCKYLPYISMFQVTKEIDTREHSSRKGKYFRESINHCSREGSVEQCLAKYDIPDSELFITVTGLHVRQKLI